MAFGADVDHLVTQDPVRRWRSPRTAFALAHLDGSDVRTAEDQRFVLLFAGLLTNIGELEAGATQADAARIVLGLVKTRGADAFNALRGPFAVIAWDKDADALLVGRDQVGLGPMFYARAASKGWLLSPSPDVLAAQPGVSSEPDAVALSEWLCGWFPAVEDTAYREVKRVPPGQRDHLPRRRRDGPALLGSVAGRRRRSVADGRRISMTSSRCSTAR